MHRLLSYNYIYLLPLLLSALASLRSFRLAGYKRYRMFSLLLVTTFLVEMLAILWKWYFHNSANWKFSPSNLWIYNGFLTIRLVLLLLFYRSMLSGDKIKKWIGTALPVLVLITLGNYIFFQGFHAVNNYSIILSHAVFVIVAITYFIEVLNDNRLFRLANEPLAWISLGTFIYYSATLPFFIFLKYLSEKFPALAVSFFYINTTLGAVMYTLYLISFICKTQYHK